MADYKLSQLTEKAALIATDIMHLRTVGAIDQKITGENLRKKNILVKDVAYTITDSDLNPIILMTTGAASKTVTLPTVADNTGKIVKLVKIDDGTGYAILDGEGAEEINGTLKWEITGQWGFVEVVSSGSAWIVLGQEGCIYEMWDNGNHTLTNVWVDYYNLPGITPGKYKIEFGVHLRVNTNQAYAYATIATAVDVENDAMYTVYIRQQATDELSLSKSFIRSFVATTTLYLNAKEITDGYMWNGGSKGYIRATRIG